MIGMNIPKELTGLATRAVEALEAIAEGLAEHNRGATMARLGGASRERIAADDRRAGKVHHDYRRNTVDKQDVDPALVPCDDTRCCPVNPTDADL